jgi:hypothetical protein
MAKAAAHLNFFLEVPAAGQPIRALSGTRTRSEPGTEKRTERDAPRGNECSIDT